MGLHHREGQAVLGEHVRHGEFPAKSIPPVGEIHLSDFVRIGLQQNRHPYVLQSGDGAVFIRENRHGKNHAVIFSPVVLQKTRVHPPLFPGFDPAVSRQSLIHHDALISGLQNGLFHFLPGLQHQFARHKSPVAKRQDKFHRLHFHRLLSRFTF